MAARCTTPSAAMHHLRGMGAPWHWCRTGGEGVCFMRSGCRTTNGQGVVLARRTHDCATLCSEYTQDFCVNPPKTACRTLNSPLQNVGCLPVGLFSFFSEIDRSICFTLPISIFKSFFLHKPLCLMPPCGLRKENAADFFPIAISFPFIDIISIQFLNTKLGLL